jgi:indolepyruvate decarboxylase
MPSLPLGKYLFRYLRQKGVEHCFGLPGDYILPLYRALEDTEGIVPIVGTHEPCAAFSADAYARQRGLGVLLVTYGVGGFNALNGVAGAYAESSPLLIITGGPPSGYRTDGEWVVPQKHHVVKTETDQLEIYKNITAKALRIENTAGAAPVIEGIVEEAVKRQLPVYLEIPADLMNAEILSGEIKEKEAEAEDDVLKNVVENFIDRIEKAARPVLLVGVEASRYRLQEDIVRIMNARGIPAATTVLGKGFLPETFPGVLGVYAGVLSAHPDVRHAIEESDLVIFVGGKVTDINCGAFTADLKKDKLLIAKSDWIGDGYGRFVDGIPLTLFIEELARAIPESKTKPEWPRAKRFDYQSSDSLMDKFIGVIGQFLNENSVLLADTGDSSYSSLFVTTHRENGYLAPTFYNTMGFAVPAALGAQLADPNSRAVVLVGDGAFQMTGMEFSNLVRYGLDTIVIVFNNAGFGMQRVFTDGPFNDVGLWDYTEIPKLVGGGKAWRARTPEELLEILGEAAQFRQGPSLIEVIVGKGIISTGLRILTEALAREKTGLCPLDYGTETICKHASKCAYCRAAIWK